MVGNSVVPVEVELDLALAPPAAGVAAPGEVGAHVLAHAAHAVDERVHPRGHRVGPPPVRVQVGALRLVAAGLVGHLVVDDGRGSRQVGEREVRALAERHRPVAAEPAVRVDRDHRRRELGEPAPPLAEEVADRHLDRGCLGAVPAGAQQQAAPVVGVGGEPDVGDPAGPVDRGQVDGGVRGDLDTGRHLPALPEVAGGASAGALGGAPAPARLARGFSGLIERVTTPGRSRVMSGIMTDRLGGPRRAAPPRRRSRGRWHAPARPPSARGAA